MGQCFNQCQYQIWTIAKSAHSLTSNCLGSYQQRFVNKFCVCLYLFVSLLLSSLAFILPLLLIF